jgi:predicted SAM-dependent methyltransferase
MLRQMRLNLGSGSAPIPGFTNVDILPDAPGVDLVADLSQPLPLDDGVADLIYASHVLEHFSTAEVPVLLAGWRRVLKDGGELLIAVPDLDIVAEIIRDRNGWFTPPHEPWQALVYGGQKDAYDFHRTGFNDVWLTKLLNDAGFGTVRRVERFSDVPAIDASYSVLPFGRNISLNLRAVAGLGPALTPPWQPGAIERTLNVVDRVTTFAMQGSTAARSAMMGRRRRQLQRELDGR